MPGSVIVAGARTPIGKLSGALRGFTAAQLGGIAIRGALERAGLTGDQIDYVILGHAIQAGAGPIASRQAAVEAGIPMRVPAVTINKLCLSGLDAIALADTYIAAGEFDLVVAGGMESMTAAPHLVRSLRAGVKYGDTALTDSIDTDALLCAFDQVSMGASTDRHNGRLAITRAEQDEIAARSHQRAAAAAKNGLFDDEIVPVTVPQRRGEPLVISADEGVRADTTAESLARLRPAFGKDGTITAGSASQLSDGAAAVIVASRAKAEELGLPILAEVGHHGFVAGPDATLHSQPSNAITAALAKEGLTPADLDLVEINEAFAAVSVQSVRELGLNPEIVNVNGGAIAIGHPLGASGTRIALTLIKELARRGGGLGAAGLCGGGGQGDALILRVPTA
ncbi:acetyl-CoA C-acetyltransferase [Frankia sp. AgPm24]|uniref:acetyl-CoA C-acetyltransferase n=1 Tax=Frankia sp. AgPm24 TaxID=631128 RepID=UPI00200BAF5C|nr:acetyl-CoA C-acetyltransferase [Frankia sp. AgPm24]MCK9924130.1 acetyl-CoA C-acetyltransferase [Frankia sp. AgPm24]